MSFAPRAQISLAVWAGLLLMGALLSWRYTPGDVPMSEASAAGDAARDGDSSVLRYKLQQWSQGQGGPVDAPTVQAALAHPSWQVVGPAYRIMRLAPERQCLPRPLVSRIRAGVEPAPNADELAAWITLLDDLLADMQAGALSPELDLLADWTTRGPSGRFRAQAFRVLVGHSADAAARQLRSMLEDPSQQVRLAALDAIGLRRNRALVAAVRPLTSDSRPAVRAKARLLLEQLGANSGPPTAAAQDLRTARRITDELVAAGLRTGDILTALGGPPGDAIDVGWLLRAAERYLDMADDSRPADVPGVLLLAAAVSANEQKLSRRLFERLMAASDSDGELLDMTFDALASRRIASALNAYLLGDRAGSLSELAALARLARPSSPNPHRLRHMAEAARLSGAIWQSTLHPGDEHADREMQRLAEQVWKGLDPRQARNEQTAAARFDALRCDCGTARR
jgi:hypothetical protein